MQVLSSMIPIGVDSST